MTAIDVPAPASEAFARIARNKAKKFAISFNRSLRSYLSAPQNARLRGFVDAEVLKMRNAAEGVDTSALYDIDALDTEPELQHRIARLEAERARIIDEVEQTASLFLRALVYEYCSASAHATDRLAVVRTDDRQEADVEARVAFVRSLLPSLAPLQEPTPEDLEKFLAAAHVAQTFGVAGRANVVLPGSVALGAPAGGPHGGSSSGGSTSSGSGSSSASADAAAEHKAKVRQSAELDAEMSLALLHVAALVSANRSRDDDFGLPFGGVA